MMSVITLVNPDGILSLNSYVFHVSVLCFEMSTKGE
jgi:hypothetical protein